MYGIYQHYKGGFYNLLNIATHSETQEELIVYQSLQDGKVWVRPKDMFFGTLPDGTPRFKKQ